MTESCWQVYNGKILDKIELIINVTSLYSILAIHASQRAVMQIGYCENKTHVINTIKLNASCMQLESCKLQHDMQLATDPITTAIKLTSCKEMGGATSHSCQSATRAVSKRLTPLIGRYRTLWLAASCTFLHTIVHSQYYANEAASLAGHLASFIIVVTGT